MAQVKVYGLRSTLLAKRETLSTAIHDSLIEAFGLPRDKRFHRYIMLDPEDFLYPQDRSEQYIIIELSIFEGRSPETKKKLIKLIYAKTEENAGIKTKDIEIIIFETSMANWGIRGVPGDELVLNYNIKT